MTYYILLINLSKGNNEDEEIVNGRGICQTEDRINAIEIKKALETTHPEYKYLISEMVRTEGEE